MCNIDGCKNKAYSKSGLCRKHHKSAKEQVELSDPEYKPVEAEDTTDMTIQQAEESVETVYTTTPEISDDRIIKLMESWNDRVKPSESKCGARNVLVFTLQSIDEVKKSFDGIREIKKIGMDIEDDIHVIKLYLASAIDRLSLSKIGLNHILLHKGFKRMNTIIDMDKDDRITKYYKKVCENDEIDYEDFIGLYPKKAFFDKYPKITLKPESIKAINHYHDQLKHKEIADTYAKVQWGSKKNLFQQTVLQIANTKPHARNIYVVQDLEGDNGKSFLCGYINTKYDVLLVDGKPDNVYYQLSQMCEEGNDPSILILDVPRESKDYLQYNTVEKLKNGLVNSGKYESKKVNIRSPHIFIFTNFYIKTDQWTSDRIKYIDVVSGEITDTQGNKEDIYGNKL
ncbi:hypothetical protein AC1031_002416 [Aphanomyces cochlioides]|nr:hypothetical protein AC1031_002416 [Aphanomyces cochlioides]